jgi:sulfopyruvate decarboxylase TPP-binding subunit
MDVDEIERAMAPDWPAEMHGVFRRSRIRHVAYVPDAGHTALIKRCTADAEITTNVLTTEEEGFEIETGAWPGGTRAAILKQSSGAPVGLTPN